MRGLDCKGGGGGLLQNFTAIVSSFLLHCIGHIRSGIVMQKVGATSQEPKLILPYPCSKVCYGGLVVFSIYCDATWQELSDNVSMVIEDRA